MSAPFLFQPFPEYAQVRVGEGYRSVPPMPILSLRVRQFRNIAAADLEFGPGANIFTGPNGQGKTNFLEAIRYAATATSHRTYHDEELIQWQADGAHLRMAVERENQSIVLECGLDRRRRLVRINESPAARISDLYGLARTVLFTPEDLHIVTGDPRGRRRFLDMAIAQIEPVHIDHLLRLQRIIRQRNALLKHLAGDVSRARELDPWDTQLAEAAASVVIARHEAARLLSECLGDVHHVLSGEQERVRLRLESDGLPGEEDRAERTFEEAVIKHLNEILVSAQESDILRGHTTKGPHRDDLDIFINDHNLRMFGSQGQRRTAVLAARLAEAEMIQRRTQEKPVLLIDDVIYEMDRERRTRFLDHVRRGGQSFATCTELEHLGPLAEEGEVRVFKVVNGSAEC